MKKIGGKTEITEIGGGAHTGPCASLNMPMIGDKKKKKMNIKFGIRQCLVKESIGLTGTHTLYVFLYTF